MQLVFLKATLKYSPLLTAAHESQKPKGAHLIHREQNAVRFVYRN